MQLNSLERSVTKTGNQLQGWGGAHLREVRTVAWASRDLNQSSGNPFPHILPCSLSRRLIPKMPPSCARTSDREAAGTRAGADPNLPQPRAVFQPRCHPVLCCQLWDWCLLSNLIMLQVHISCVEEARRASKYLLGDCHGIGFATLHGQICLFPSSINTKMLPSPHFFLPEVSARICS